MCLGMQKTARRLRKELTRLGNHLHVKECITSQVLLRVGIAAGHEELIIAAEELSRGAHSSSEVRLVRRRAVKCVELKSALIETCEHFSI